MATEQEKADLSKKRGQASATISDPDQKRKFVAAQGEAEKKGNANYEGLNKEADDTLATGGQNIAAGVKSYKFGTNFVPKTGLALLHKGEKVTPAKENSMMNASDAMAGITGKKAVPEKKIHKITTHKSDDGKLIHTHLHHHSNHHPDETHISNNLGEAQDHLAAQEPNMSAQPPAMPEAGAPAAGAM
jgi:hypothetical protein